MGDHNAIADAGETLVDLLRDRMTRFQDKTVIQLASPVEEDLQPKVRLTVFLYEVTTATPMDTPRTNGRSPGPLKVDLTYLLTAHKGKQAQGGSTSTTTKTQNRHTLLGRAMQILRDNAIVEEPDLRGSLAEGDETLQISLLPEETNTVVNIWNTFQNEPYETSVAYLVTPVEIDSRHEESAERVEQIRIHEHVPGNDTDE